MSKRDVHDVIVAAFANPTKLAIITVLSKHEELTVTQLSKYLGVSRPNLYLTVKEMVKDGLLQKPRVRVRHNFLEKFYRLNKQAIREIDPAEQQKRLYSSTPENQTAVIKSMLESMSLFFKLHAEEVTRADETTLNRIAKAVRANQVMIHYSLVSADTYSEALGKIREIIKKTGEKSGEKGELNNTLIILGIPTIGKS
ncbi:MAG TPA: helix-turn-helix domain-containing protein [Candidatus Bathyarchaeia archaeon]